MASKVITIPVTGVAPESRSCVVCGAGSHRTDWIQKDGDFVACDVHSKEEFQDAIKNAKTIDTTPKVPAKPVSSVPTGTKPVAGTAVAPLKSDNPNLAPAPIPAKPSDLSAGAPNPSQDKPLAPEGKPVNAATPVVTPNQPANPQTEVKL